MNSTPSGSTKRPENMMTTITMPPTIAPTEMQTTVSETSKLSPLTYTEPVNTATEIKPTSTEKPASDKIEYTARPESTDQVTEQVSEKISTSTSNRPMISTGPTIELTTKNDANSSSNIPSPETTIMFTPSMQTTETMELTTKNVVRPSSNIPSPETTVMVTASMQTIEGTTEKVMSTSLKPNTVDVDDKIDDILEFTTIVSLLQKFQVTLKPTNFSQSVFSG